jgi:hypothetical protein
MAELIAVVSIIAGAAVAIIVPFIGARLERSRLVQQSRDARINELRDLLDATLQHLYVAGTILYEIQEESNHEWSDTRLDKLGVRLTEQTDVVHQDSIRIQLRISPDAAIAQSIIDGARIISQYELTYRLFLSDVENREQTKPPPSPVRDIWEVLSTLMRNVRAFAGIVQAPDVTSPLISPQRVRHAPMAPQRHSCRST